MSVPNDRLPVMTASVLDREMFSEAEASRILRVPQSTLHWWLNGGMYGNRKVPPRGPDGADKWTIRYLG
jgi:hypothetical protein